MSKKIDKCSFCGRSENEVRQLFQGPSQDVFICNNCVEGCHSLMNEEDPYSLEEEYKMLEDMYKNASGEKYIGDTI